MSWHGNNNNQDINYKAVSRILLGVVAGNWEAAVAMAQVQDAFQSCIKPEAGGFMCEVKTRITDIFDLST